jgi:tetratricopeptide (TPR) repeat protein
MKRLALAPLAALFFVQCSAMQTTQTPVRKVQVIQADWAYFSRGLYFKSAADYPRAIENFMDAAAYDTALDKVYYQLAECYYRINDYENAVNYADRSIGKNPQYIRPYELKFNLYANLRNYEKAAASLEALVEERPELVHIHYTLGNLYYTQMKNWDRASVYMRNIIELAASEPVEDYYQEYAHYYLGHIYYSKNQTERAIKSFERCIEINPDNISAVYVLALIYMDQYRLEEARRYSLQYLEKLPDNAKLNAVMGRIYYLKGDHRAISHLKKIRGSRMVEGALGAALYNELMRNDKEAGKALGDILKKNPGYISPHIALARIALRRGDKTNALSEYFTAGALLFQAKLYDLAKENLFHALSIKDDIPEIYFYLARTCEETGDLSLALVYYRKCHDLKPSPDILIHMGYLYSLKNDFARSADYLDRAITLDPDNSKPHFFKGLIDSQRDRFTIAERHFRKAIELQGENDTYYFYLATVLEKQSRIGDTIEALKKSIKYNPKSARAYNFLGYLYADNNMNLDESIDLIKKALEYEPSNGAYLDSLGWAYFRKSQFDLALKNLLEAEKELAREKSPDPVVYDHIGDTYIQMGKVMKAVEYWDKSLKMKKDPIVEKKLKEAKSRLQ